MPAKWHFATSHGKSAGDDAGRTLKRKASLQHAYKDHILLAQDLYQFALNNIKGMDFEFVESKEHDLETKELEQQHSKTSLLHPYF